MIITRALLNLQWGSTSLEILLPPTKEKSGHWTSLAVDFLRHLMYNSILHVHDDDDMRRTVVTYNNYKY